MTTAAGAEAEIVRLRASPPHGRLAPVTRAMSAQFIGRKNELARLRDAYEQSAAGVAQTVLLGGEAGVGKTRLVEQFGSTCAGRLAIGSCVEVGGDGVPYAAFTGVLRTLNEEGVLSCAGWERDELARLLPELGAAPPTRIDDEFGRARLFEAVRTALANAAADRPWWSWRTICTGPTAPPATCSATWPGCCAAAGSC